LITITEIRTQFVLHTADAAGGIIGLVI